jgi:crotonobetainyl-CoA:carnitine CoA-transferase CaiB-like acyl-CoA transferase
MYAFSGTLAALYRREITGEGASIEVSFELGRDAQTLDKLVAAQVDSRS